MQWLPALHWAGTTWLIPLSLSTADFLASRFIDSAADSKPADDPEWSAVLMADQLRRDPALLVFAALEYVREQPCDRAPKDAQPLDLHQLAAWLESRLAEIYRDSERRLLEFEPQQCISRQPDSPRWNELAAAVRSQPLGSWMESATQWLEPGDRPVPDAWRQRWPRVTDPESQASGLAGVESDGDLGFGRSNIDLHRLARLARDTGRFRHHFAQRLQVARMGSLRQLAYGLSHEINNPLASIRTRAEQLSGELRSLEHREQCGRIVDATMRAHEMIADLMYFARPPRPEPVPFCAVELVDQLVAEYEPRTGARGIALQHRARSRRLELTADSDQIRDALRALLDNAIEAVDQHGAIAVETRATANRVVWTLHDSGPGLSPTARQHAFDPYYSGREAGRGLGLGLCRAYRVARSHGGGVRLDNVTVGCRARLWVRRAP